MGRAVGQHRISGTTIEENGVCPRLASAGTQRGRQFVVDARALDIETDDACDRRTGGCAAHRIVRHTEHHAVVVLSGAARDLAVDDVAQHRIRVALEWIPPSPTAGGPDAYELARTHWFGQRQTVHLTLVGSTRIDGRPERLA